MSARHAIPIGIFGPGEAGLPGGCDRVPSPGRLPRHAPFLGRPAVARLLTRIERPSSPADGIAGVPLDWEADDSSVEPLIGTYTIHPTRFLETGTAPLSSPCSNNPSFRKERPDAAADLEEAKLELRPQTGALVGSPEILSLQSQVLGPLPPLNYAKSGDLHQALVPGCFC